MNCDEKLSILRRIDRMAQAANTLWHQCESMKLEVAKILHIRPFFERAFRQTLTLNSFSLDRMGSGYRSPDTTFAWIGFGLGFRCAERVCPGVAAAADRLLQRGI